MVTSPIASASSAPNFSPVTKYLPTDAGGHLRQQRQRDDRRCDAETRLGEREGAVAPGDHDVARADESEARRPARGRRSAPTTGSGSSRIARSSRVSSRDRSAAPSNASPDDASERSAPAQKVPPVWPSTTARTSGFAAASPKAWCSCSTSVDDSALRFCGESRVIRAVAPSTQYVDQCGHQYDRGRPSEVWATKLSTISRLTGAIRDNLDMVSAEAMPYSLVRPFPPSD